MNLKQIPNIPLDEYINLSLYDKKFGYYIKKNPFGKKGDFTTAPNISRLFSEMIAIWILSFWQNLGSPKNLNLVKCECQSFISLFVYFVHYKKKLIKACKL